MFFVLLGDKENLSDLRMRHRFEDEDENQGKRDSKRALCN